MVKSFIYKNYFSIEELKNNFKNNSIYMYVLLNVCNLICCFGSSIMVPFFPVFASDRDIGLDTVGWIFALFPFGMFIASLILGKVQNDVLLFKNRIIGPGLWHQVSLFKQYNSLLLEPYIMLRTPTL